MKALLRGIGTIALGLSLASAQAQSTNPIVTTWLLNTTSATGFNSLTANVASVKYSSGSVYIATAGIPSYSRTYVASTTATSKATNNWWPQPTGGPVAVTYTSYRFRLPLTPTPNTGTPVAVPGGTLGLWINGTNIHPAKDASSYNNQGAWFTDAVVNEGVGFDDCNGHPDISSIYHTHVNPDCLYDRRDSTRHSPIIGWAMDGYPVYGAYGYKIATDPTSGIKSMKSSYRLRSITTRTTMSTGDGTGATTPTTFAGPAVSTTYPLGKYVLDNEYITGLGDLNANNGRWCVTPEFPAGTYAYFSTINSLYEGAYPYTLAGNYYGTVPYDNQNSTSATISEAVTTYSVPTSLTVSSGTKVLAGGTFTNVTVGTGAALTVLEPLTVSTATSVQSGGTLDLGTLDLNTTTVGGAGSFTLASGAKLKIDNPVGITSSGATGAVQNTGTRTFNSGAEYVYEAAAAQVTGNGLPSPVSKLTVNNTAVSSGMGPPANTLTLSQSQAISGTLTLTAGTLATSTGQTLTINSGGTLVAGTNIVVGPGAFTLASGGTLKTGNTAGITSSGTTGTVQVGGARSFNAGASYEYNGTAAQVTGSGLPAAPATLTINNASGVTLSSTAAVSSALNLTSGKLSTASGVNLTVSNGATMNAGTNYVDGAGNFTLASGATLKTANTAGLTSGTTASGTIQNTGTTRSFNTGASYEYNGTAAQVTGAGLPATVANLTINNAAGVALTSNTTVNTALTTTSGVLNTGANKITLGSSATLTETGNSSSTGYVTGTVETTRNLSTANTVYDIGGTGLTLTPTGSTLPGSTLVSRVTGTAPSSVYNSTAGVKRYYSITPTTNAGLSVTMKFIYRDDELNGIAEDHLGFYKSTVSPTTGPWTIQRLGTVTRDATANSVSMPGITGFSTWTLGYDPYPLPVELSRFEAAREGAGVLLRWATASEKNNSHFEVERSADGKVFSRIGTVEALSRKGGPSDYTFLDPHTLLPSHPQTLYYRLRQVDTDGAASYSPVRAVVLGGEELLTLYPNPAQGEVWVQGAPAGQVLDVLDATGRRIATATAGAEGTLRLALPAGLAPGVYVVKCGSQVQRLTVQ